MRELSGRLEAWMRDTGDPLLDGPVPPPPGAEINDPDQLSASEPTHIAEQPGENEESGSRDPR